MSEVCALCLGGETDVPPFATAHDARDLIHPCATCSLVTHRKCLVDWFSSLNLDSLEMVDSLDINAIRRSAVVSSTQQTENGPGGNANANDNENGNLEANDRTDDSFMFRILNSPDYEIGNGTFGFELSSQELSDWVNSLSNPNTFNFLTIPDSVYFVAKCFQCKSDIVFRMKRSKLLMIVSAFKVLLRKFIQYSTLFIGVTSAVTGVVSMGYIGLTSCGLKTMESILPQSYLMEMLCKSLSNRGTLNSILFKSNYSVDNLEVALSKGLIDPLKFSKIPILPIIMYRMRNSSFVQCVFNNPKANRVSNWLTELMINGYISSLGNHMLFKSVYTNLSTSIINMVRNPWKFYRYLNIFRGVDFWNINNMVSLLIPIRITYDLAYKLILNPLHFNILIHTRPKQIADSLSSEDFDKLEILNNRVHDLWMRLLAPNHKESSKVRLLFKEPTMVWDLIKFQTSLSFHKTIICLRDDYSKGLLQDSITMKCLTTIIWPFISSKVGSWIFKLVAGRCNQDSDKLMLLSNLIGLVSVVVIKDLVNLYLSYKKGKELSDLRIQERIDQTLPGVYRH